MFGKLFCVIYGEARRSYMKWEDVGSGLLWVPQ